MTVRTAGIALPRRRGTWTPAALFALWIAGAAGAAAASQAAAPTPSGGHDTGPASPGPAGSAPAEGAMMPLPDIMVTLMGDAKRFNHLKVHVLLELEKPADTAAVERVLPRILDSFQVYLRELRLNDLHGPAGLSRLRQEMLRRVQEVVRPTKVKDLLFKEMLVQ